MVKNVYELLSLKGRIAIVTGGAGYLGTAMSFGLAEAGARVIIGSRNETNCRNLANEINKKGLSAEGIHLDVTKEDSVIRTINDIYNKYGKIDIMVNSGGKGYQGLHDKVPLGNWEKTIKAVLTSVYLCTRYVAEKMKIQKKGSIINIASMYGCVAPDMSIYGETGWDSPASYNTAKGGVIQFTKYCASYYAKYGIRVNSISPGTFPPLSAKERNTEFVRIFDRLAGKTMLKRVGVPEDLKGIVLYLASNASAYCTGQNMVIDGGWTIW